MLHFSFCSNYLTLGPSWKDMDSERVAENTGPNDFDGLALSLLI